jgi:hypothetical protein
MSFTLDGIEIETVPATMVSLACGSAQVMSGHSVGERDFVACDDCNRDYAEHYVSDVTTMCQVVRVFRTEIVPTGHI